MERALEEFVWRRARNCCEYCRMPQEYDDGTLEIDHIIATSHGGLTQASNLCLACFSDNSFKGPNLSGIDPKTRKIVALSIPAATPGIGISGGTVRSLWAGHQLGEPPS